MFSLFFVPLYFLFFLSSFFSFPPLLSCVIFFILLPCFYRQKQGRGVAGVATVLPPHNCPRGMFPFFSPPRGRPQVKVYTRGAMVGIFLMLLRKRSRGKQRKNLLLPLFCASRGRRKVTVSFKTTPFWSHLFFFAWTVHETVPFWTKRIVKEKRAKLMPKSKLVFNL